MLPMYNHRYMQDEEAPNTTEELLTYMETTQAVAAMASWSSTAPHITLQHGFMASVAPLGVRGIFWVLLIQQFAT